MVSSKANQNFRHLWLPCTVFKIKFKMAIFPLFNLESLHIYTYLSHYSPMGKKVFLKPFFWYHHYWWKPQIEFTDHYFCNFFPSSFYLFYALSSFRIKLRAIVTMMGKNILCFVNSNKSQASKWQAILLARINIQWCLKKEPVYAQSQMVLIIF